jgi:hypothetical protein
MDLDELLADSEAAILDDAFTGLKRIHAAHYEAAGESVTRERQAQLFALVVAAIRDRDLAHVVAYAQTVGVERFNAGFGFSEVQTAFNVMEEAMWRRVVAEVRVEELAESIGLLSTVLGAAKDALARSYVSLASSRHVPSLDLSALFRGIDA